MTPAELIAAFDVLAEAPDGVKRLRELVLQLAVRGRLVEQVASDAPAEQLIAGLGVRAFSRAKASKPSAPIEALFEIPESWAWSRFDRVADIASDLVDPKDYGDSPHVAPDSIEKGNGRLMAFRTIAEDRVTSAKHRFHAGQILYSKIRPNLSKVVCVDFDGLCSADMYPISPRIERRYLHCFMLSFPFVKCVTADDNRLAMPKVNQEQLSAIPVPVPPLAEQHRIVARVDELMTLLDRLEAARNKHETLRVAARDSALAALRGVLATTAAETLGTRVADLVESPSDVESLRATILQLAMRGMLRSSRRTSTEISNSGLVALPDRWAWVRLGEICGVTDGDHLPPPQVSVGVPFLTIGNLRGRKLDFASTRQVPHTYFERLAETRVPRKGDLLYTVVGATYGRPVKVECDTPFCVQRHIAIIKPSAVVSQDFLDYFLRSPLAYAQATAALTGSAQPTLALRPLRLMLVPLPPLEEQHRIVAKVDALMGLCDALEARLTTARDLQGAFAAAAVHHLDTSTPATPPKASPPRRARPGGRAGAVGAGDTPATPI